MGKYTGKKCRLLAMMFLTLGFFIVEIVVGYKTNSMALVADSFHMLADVAALIISLLSRVMSPKKSTKNTFGWARAEVLGALVNAVFLVAICLSITVEAFQRIIEQEEVQEPKLLVIVGVIGFFVNLIGIVLLYEDGGHGHSHDLSHSHTNGHSHGHLHGHPHVVLVRCNSRVNESTILVNRNDECDADDKLKNTADEVSADMLTVSQKPGRKHAADHMNIHGAFLHILNDAIGSVIVVISALIVWKTDWEYRFYIDPVLSIFLVFLILHSVCPLLRESALVLLQTVPPHIQVEAIEKRLVKNVPGVMGVHEFHVWQLSGDRIIATAHVKCLNLLEYMNIGTKIKAFFHNEGIHSTTIQLEFMDADGDTEWCAFDCPITEEGCVKATCCQIDNRNRTPSPRDTPTIRQRPAARHDTDDAASIDINL